MLHELLKKRTSHEHHAIEQVVNFSLITRCPESYVKLLRTFLGFYLPVETYLENFSMELSDVGISLNEVSQSEHLVNDLLILTRLNPTENLAFCLDLPELNNFSQVMGLLYVLEGSRLGGQIIFNGLNFENNSIDKNLLKFHQGYKEHTGVRWRHFLKIINTHSQLNEEAVIKTSQETFIKLKNWLIKND